jgi:predicted GIY-YIG superfamily endonuclease
MSQYSVYTLTDPRDNQVRYVGITTNPDQRYRDHIALVDYAPVKEAWIRDALANDAVPTLSIIDHADNESDARALEAYWILQFHLAGSKLTNKETANITTAFEEERLIVRLKARALKAKPQPVPLQLQELQHINEEVLALKQENQQLKEENQRLREIVKQIGRLAQQAD